MTTIYEILGDMPELPAQPTYPDSFVNRNNQLVHKCNYFKRDGSYCQQNTRYDECKFHKGRKKFELCKLCHQYGTTSASGCCSKCSFSQIYYSAKRRLEVKNEENTTYKYMRKMFT